MGLRVNKLAALISGGAGGALALAITTVADNVTAGTVISPITVPAGYTLLLTENCGSRFDISGSNFVTGTTILEPGAHLPEIYAFKTSPTSPGPACLTIAPVITVTAAALPSDISGLLMANNIDDAVVSGSNITSIPGTYGTAVALTGAGSVGVPQLVTGIGPNGKNVAQISATASDSQKFTFTAQNPAVMTACICCSINLLTTNQTFMTDGTAANNITTSGTGTNGCINTLSFRTTGMSAAVTLTLSAAARIQAALKTIHFIRFEIDTGAQTAKVWVNEVAGGTVTLTASSGQSWSALFAIGSNTLTNGMFTSFRMFNKALSTTEAAQLYAMTNPWRSRSYFFAAAGSDSNNGWNSSFPKQNIDTFLNANNGYPNDRYLTKGGDLLLPAAAISVPTATGTGNQGTATGPIIFGAYSGTTISQSAKAHFSLATVIPKNTAAWTNAGGDVWTGTGTATDPLIMWALGVDTTGAVQVGNEPLTGAPYSHTFQPDSTANGAWRFTTAGTAYTVRMGAGQNPNNFDISVPSRATNFGTFARDFWVYQDFVQEGGGGILSQWGGATVNIHRLLSYQALNDAYNMSGTGPYVNSNSSTYNMAALPLAYSDTASTGDTLTGHGTTPYTAYNCIAAYSSNDFCVDQSSAVSTFNDCLSYLNAKGWVKETAAHTTNGAMTLARCLFVRPAITTDGSFTADYGVQSGTGTTPDTAGTIITVTNTMFDGTRGSVRGTAVNIIGGAAGATLVDGGGNLFPGFTGFKNF